MNDVIDVIVADDGFVTREGMRSLFGTMPEYRVVAEIDDIRKLPPLADVLHPALVIVDLKWGADLKAGLDAVAHLKASSGFCKVLAMSAHDDLLEAAMARGADATLSKDMDRAEMAAVIANVTRSSGSGAASAVHPQSNWPARLRASLMSFLELECRSDIAGLSPEGMALLTQVIPKVEAIERLCPPRPLPMTDGFEVFRLGADATGYALLRQQAKQFGVPESLLAATSLIVGFETADVLRWEGRLLGLQVDSLQVSINLDMASITSGLAAAVFQRYQDRLGFVTLEVHEALKGKLAIVALEELLESFGAIVVLDDVNKLDAGARRRLHSRMTAAKIDFRSFQAMARDLGAYGDAVVAELVGEAREKPLIVEGVAEQIHVDFLRRRWPRLAPPLFIQGYRVHPRMPWTKALTPLGDRGHPSGYTIRR